MDVVNSRQSATLRTVAETSLNVLAVLWREDRWLCVSSFLWILLPTGIPFANALIYAQIINYIVASVAGHHQSITVLYVLIAVRVLVLFLQGAFYILQRRANRAMATKIPLLFTQKLVEHVAQLDIETLENGDFQNKLQDAKDQATWRVSTMTQNLLYSAQALLQMVIAAVSLIFLNWIFAVVVTLAAIPTFYYQIFSSRFAWNIWSGNSPYRKRYNYLVYSIQRVTHAKELRLFGLNTYFVHQTKKIADKFVRENMAAIDRHLTFGLLADSANVVGYAVVEVYMVLQTLGRHLSLGSLTYYTTALYNYQNGIGNLFGSLSSVMDDTQYVQNMFTVLSVRPKMVVPTGVILPADKPPRIEFRDVSFRYPEAESETIHNLSLVIEPGEKVAFVGENGAGKTTIIKLLCRFYDVTSGEILVNGVNIKELDLDSWRANLGVLFQDFLKYEYSLRDNIKFGRIDHKPGRDEVQRAAEEAGADSVAKALQHGYGQMLGKTFEDGVEISGGQWQKVALAKAFYRNAPVLILDEPTSAIDARAEREIFQRVEKLASNKTVCIISHRFSTVRNADKIYVIDNGQVIEAGTHHALMKLRGVYAELFNLQADAYK